MNGPQHYREAENPLAYIEDGAYRDQMNLSEEAEHSIAARAQAYATLALAAATALQDDPTIGIYRLDRDAWMEVACVRDEAVTS